MGKKKKGSKSKQNFIEPKVGYYGKIVYKELKIRHTFERVNLTDPMSHEKVPHYEVVEYQAYPRWKTLKEGLLEGGPFFKGDIIKVGDISAEIIQVEKDQNNNKVIFYLDHEKIIKDQDSVISYQEAAEAVDLLNKQIGENRTLSKSTKKLKETTNDLTRKINELQDRNWYQRLFNKKTHII